MQRMLLSLFVIGGFTCPVFAATFISAANGNWNAAGTWTLTGGTDADGIPDSDDDVTIDDGSIVTMTQNEACNSLTLVNLPEILIS